MKAQELKKLRDLAQERQARVEVKMSAIERRRHAVQARLAQLRAVPFGSAQIVAAALAEQRWQMWRAQQERALNAALARIAAERATILPALRKEVGRGAVLDHLLKELAEQKKQKL